MGRNKSSITEAELRIMQVLWNRSRLTVAQIVQALPPPQLAHTTVQTMLKVLEDKGHVMHEQHGRAFYYCAVTSHDEASAHAVGHVLRHYFAGRPGALALRLLQQEQLDERELNRLEELIEQRRPCHDG